MLATLGDDALTLLLVLKQAAELIMESFVDDQNSDVLQLPSSYGILMHDRRLSINQIANIHSISREMIGNTLHNDIGITKVVQRWMPCLLTTDQKYTRLFTSRQNLTLFQTDPASILK